MIVYKIICVHYNKKKERNFEMLKRKALSLIECLVSIVIILILAGSFALSPNAFKKTAKTEAEKFYAAIHRAMLRADRTHESFSLEKIYDKGLLIRWEKQANEEITVSPGFILEWNFSSNPAYSTENNSFNLGGTITIRRKEDNSEHYVIIYSPGGRIRTSHIKPW